MPINRDAIAFQQSSGLLQPEIEIGELSQTSHLQVLLHGFAMIRAFATSKVQDGGMTRE
jgi:hypothetical protein